MKSKRLFSLSMLTALLLVNLFPGFCQEPVTPNASREARALQEAGVPVLWRPYHEMNGDWFWWGGKSALPGNHGRPTRLDKLGDAGTAMIPYRMKANQDGDLLFLKKYNIVEWGDDRISNEEINLDGSEMVSQF